MFSAAAWFPFWQEWQPYFHARLGSGVEVMGWIFCLFSVAQIAGAEMVSRLRFAREQRALYMAWNVAISSAVLVAGGLSAGRVGVAFAMFMVAQFCAGSSTPVIQSWFNEEIEGDNRATLLSFGSTFATFGATAGLPMQGMIVDAFGMGAAWQGAGVLAMLQAPIFLAMRPKRG
jgi:predicted MFS family arabinose efflux permease